MHSTSTCRQQGVPARAASSHSTAPGAVLTKRLPQTHTHADCALALTGPLPAAPSGAGDGHPHRQHPPHRPLPRQRRDRGACQGTAHSWHDGGEGGGTGSRCAALVVWLGLLWPQLVTCACGPHGVLQRCRLGVVAAESAPAWTHVPAVSRLQCPVHPTHRCLLAAACAAAAPAHLPHPRLPSPRRCLRLHHQRRRPHRHRRGGRP